MLKYTEIALTHTEVPGESCLCIYIAGCVNHCENCHYPDLQSPDAGDPLTENFDMILDLYADQTTCVCFMGEGSNNAASRDELTRLCTKVHRAGFESCLYSGRDIRIEPWMHCFDYIKLGSYRLDRGPLTDRNTNQKLFAKIGREYFDVTKWFWGMGW